MRNKKSGSENPGFRETLSWTLAGYKLWTRLAPGLLSCISASALIAALQPLMVLFFSARVINELAGARDIRSIAWYAAGAVGLSFVLSVLKAALQRKQSTLGGYSAFIRLFEAEALHFARMDFSHTENTELTEMLANMDTKTRGNGLGMWSLVFRVQAIVQNLCSLILSAALLAGMFTVRGEFTQTLVTSPWSIAALLALFLLWMALTALYRKPQKKMMDLVFSENAKGNTFAWYYMRYISPDQAAKDIRLYGQQQTIQKAFWESFVSARWYQFFFFMGRFYGFGAAMLALFGGCTYLVIGLRALYGMYAIGDVTQYVGAVTALAAAVTGIVQGLGELYNNASYIKPMLDYLALPDRIEKGDRPMPEPNGAGYEFEFRNVSFQYPGSDQYALKDLNLTLRAGQRMAVVGLNGSGKTTMIKLLCRLYEPTEGEILLDGVNIRAYDYDQYLALFSVVFQDFQLFPLPLGENVASGERYDPLRARSCLDGAGFGERLETMEHGLDTVLYKDYDENGVQISGGEAQKIALARALYKGAPMVVLDEPTAALDPIAEYEVYSTFDQTIGEKTAVFISHRLSSCRFCDDIAVFDGGRLVQRGNHEALLAQPGGRYAQLWHAQAQHYVIPA